MLEDLYSIQIDFENSGLHTTKIGILFGWSQATCILLNVGKSKNKHSEQGLLICILPYMV